MILIVYLLKFSIALFVIYAFYALLLRKLTFYKWNRLFLLIYSLACFIIPFINLDPLLQNTAVTPEVLEAIPPFNNFVPANSNVHNVQFIIFAFISTGSLICLAKLIMQFLSFRKIKRKAVLLHNAGNVRIYSSEAGCSFTMGNDIYIDTTAHSHDELEKVLQHELIHVKQRHWIDLITGELLIIVNWFNPFAWLMRAAIRQNLEYIADQQVLQKGYDSKSYQYLLLKVSNLQSFSIAAHFSLSDLKNRINMMNKIKSARVHLVKFVFILPFVIMMLFAFRTVNPSPLIGVFNTADTILPDTTKDSLQIGILTADTIIVTNNNFSKNIIYTGGEQLIVIYNNKSKEPMIMTMKEWNRNKRANEKKYGKLPESPKPPVPPMPPVAPVPQAAPVPPVAPEVPAEPDVQEAPVPEPPVAPAPPVPPVAPVKIKSK